MSKDVNNLFMTEALATSGDVGNDSHTVTISDDVASTLTAPWLLYKPNTVRVIARSSSKSVLIQRKMYAMQMTCANGWALKFP